MPGWKSWEQEPGAVSRSREPGAVSWKPGAGSREPGAGSREPGSWQLPPLAPGSLVTKTHTRTELVHTMILEHGCSTAAISRPLWRP